MSRNFLDDYEPVEERLERFWSDHPDGRVHTELHLRDGKTWVLLASVYRLASDPDPFATGYASENDGEGNVNRTSALENAETSAIGRALANGGYAAKRKRPSREEMRKVGEPTAPEAVIQAWVETLNALPDESKKAQKAEFVRLFGLPHNVLASKAADVDAWLSEIGDRPNGEGGTQVDGPVTVDVAAGATDTTETASPDVEDAGLISPPVSKPAPAATPEPSRKKIAKGEVQALRSFLLSKSFQPDELTEYRSVVVDRDLATMADLYAHEVEIIKLSTSMRAGR